MNWHTFHHLFPWRSPATPNLGVLHPWSSLKNAYLVGAELRGAKFTMTDLTQSVAAGGRPQRRDDPGQRPHRDEPA
jgi:hypothetical protein